MEYVLNVMENNSNFTKYSQIILVLLLILSVLFNFYLYNRKPETIEIEKEVVRVESDTIHDTVPKLITEKVIRHIHDTLRVIELAYSSDSGYPSTGAAIVEIPITQKEYSDDSTYRAWVSGYKPNLDSIHVRNKSVYIENTIIKKKNDRFIIGPHVGYGVNGFDFGIGITYKVFGF